MRAEAARLPAGEGPWSCCASSVPPHRCRFLERCAQAGLSPVALAELDGHLQHRVRVGKGQILYSEGQPMASICVVNSGCFKTSFSCYGHSQVVGFQMPGDFVALEALGEEGHGSQAQALELATVCALETPMLWHWVSLDRHFRQMLRRDLSRRMGGAAAQMLLLAQMSAEERVLAFLADWTARAHGLGYSSSAALLRMSRHDIASYLGLSTETVSRTLTQLKHRHWIAVEGRDISLLGARAPRGQPTACVAGSGRLSRAGQGA